MAIDYSYCSPQGQIKIMARPEGAQALRAIQKDLDEGRSLPGINYTPLPGIGEGLGEWFEASSYGKKRLEMMRPCRGIPAYIQDKQIIASKFGEFQYFPYLCPQKDKVMISTTINSRHTADIYWDIIKHLTC